MSVMVSIGSTIAHAYFKSNLVRKGQPGLQRAMDNPIKINIDKNLDQRVAKIKNLLAVEIGRVFPGIIDNLKPDDDEFEVNTDIIIRL